MENNIENMAFAAIGKSIIDTIPKLVQTEVRGKNYISYGDDNLYPQYLFALYQEVSTLKTIIDGTADYIAGDDVMCNIPGMETQINRRGDTIRDFVRWCAKDYMIYGGYAYEIIRNKMLKPCEINYLDFRFIRTDKKNEAFWYSEEFDKKWGKTSKAIVYPKYIKDSTAPASVVYVKNGISTTYPIPRYSGAIDCCEIERNIDKMHLNSLANGFMGSYIINFNSGIPSDEQKKEIEKNVNEKLGGTANAGRIVLNFGNSKDNMTTVQKLDITDFGEKYDRCSQRAREQIYCSFQANPCLFGLNTEQNGFSDIEFAAAFKLYNSTVIKSIQRNIVDSLDKVFGMKGSITIQPFSLGDINNNNNTNVQ